MTVECMQDLKFCNILQMNDQGPCSLCELPGTLQNITYEESCNGHNYHRITSSDRDVTQGKYAQLWPVAILPSGNNFGQQLFSNAVAYRNTVMLFDSNKASLQVCLPRGQLEGFSEQLFRDSVMRFSTSIFCAQKTLPSYRNQLFGATECDLNSQKV